MQAEIGIIGGTGFYDPQFLRNIKEKKMDTPYGRPSDVVTIGELGGRKVAFIPRHARQHTIRPTDVNYRANINALKQLGVQWILSPSTVGSLREEFKPGDLVFVDQFIDRTTGREESFYESPKVCHISVAEPTCPELRKLLIKTAVEMNLNYHKSGTYVCIEGPRFSTKAESRLFRSWDADVVGMTLVPECVLAREAEICYASISTVTDYDCWKDHPVTAGEVGRIMRENIEKVKHLIKETVRIIPEQRVCQCKSALRSAMV
jgi:5'-methylthioadenosine phosphorylase